MHLDRQIVSRCKGLTYFGNVLITYSSKHVSNVASIRKAPEVSLGQYLRSLPWESAGLRRKCVLGACSGNVFWDMLWDCVRRFGLEARRGANQAGERTGVAGMQRVYECSLRRFVRVAPRDLECFERSHSNGLADAWAAWACESSVSDRALRLCLEIVL